MNTKKYLDHLKHEVDDLHMIGRHPKLYNFRNRAVSLSLEFALEYGWMYLLPIWSSFFITKAFTDIDFTSRDIVEVASCRTIDTSNGDYLEYVSFDGVDGEVSFCYTTGWKMNEEGVYERILTPYQIDSTIVDCLSLSDKKIAKDTMEQLFSYSKEEADQLFEKKPSEVITKDELSYEDLLYQEDAFVLYNYKMSKDDVRVRERTVYENILSYGTFYGIWFGLFALEAIALRITGKEKQKIWIASLKEKFPIVSSTDIDFYQELYQRKLEDLALFDDSQTLEEDNFCLRKKR